MLAVIDWTPVLTAAVSGIAGASGYFAAWLQGKTEIRKLTLEHEQPHLQHRQAVYHDFLDSAHRMYLDARGVLPFADETERRQHVPELQHQFTAVQLFGSKAAAERAADFWTALTDAVG